MNVFIVMTDIGTSADVDKVFLQKEDAEKYCNYSNQWILEKEVIK